MIENTLYYQYAQDVLSDKVVACEYIKLACQRFMDDLKRTDLKFIPQKVDRVINFVSKLKHFQGKHSGKPFLLQPWQQFIVANVYGFMQYDSDEDVWKRRYNYIDIQISRKAGKTALVAALSLYGLIYDGEQSAEVILAATTREQATIAFNLCKGFAKSLDPHQKYLKVLRSSISYSKTNSILKVISADASRNDGFNASFGCCDETAAHRDSRLFDVIKSSQAMRQSPLLWCISTPQYDKSCFFYQHLLSDIEILKGLKEDDSIFAMIFGLDEGDNWKDESLWLKVQPNLGVTVSKDYMRKQVVNATNDPTQEVGIRTKTFCEWCDSSETWIPDSYIEDAMLIDGKKFVWDWERYRGKEIWVSIDLASVQDFTCICFMVYDEEYEKFAFKVYSFLPEETVKNHPNKVFYELMVRNGYLIATPGNITNYDYILNLMLELQRDYSLSYMSIGYDRYNASDFVQTCEQNDLNMEICAQTITNFNAPTKCIERMLLSHQILLDTNFIVLWAFRNVVLMRDSNENIKPGKATSNNKIDPVITIVMCVAMYIINMGIEPKIYTVDLKD